MKLNVCGVDIGLTGGIVSDEVNVQMPTIKIMLTEPKYINDLDKKGNKQYYKSGSKKGEVKLKLKKAATYKNELNTKLIYEIFKANDIVVIEHPGISMGNSAKSSATTNRNYGKLLACAELAECEIIPVAPNKWKRDLGLSKDKQDSIELAESISNVKYKTNKGRLLDGQAEAFLIKYWHEKLKKPIV